MIQPEAYCTITKTELEALLLLLECHRAKHCRKCKKPCKLKDAKP